MKTLMDSWMAGCKNKQTRVEMGEGGMLDWVQFNILNLMGLKYYLHKFWINLQVLPSFLAGPDLLNLEFRCSEQEWLGFEASAKIMCLHRIQYVHLVKHAPFTLSLMSSNCLQQLCAMYPSCGAQWHRASINHAFSNQLKKNKWAEQRRIKQKHNSKKEPSGNDYWASRKNIIINQRQIWYRKRVQIDSTLTAFLTLNKVFFCLFVCLSVPEDKPSLIQQQLAVTATTWTQIFQCMSIHKWAEQCTQAAAWPVLTDALTLLVVTAVPPQRVVMCLITLLSLT